MKDFNKGGYGGNKGGGFNKGGFNKGGFGGNRGGNDRGGFGGGRDRGSVTMHKATCADCGNMAEVPFKPNGEKPVLCQDCFGGKKDGGFRSHDRGNDRGGFQGKPSFGDRRPTAAPVVDVKKLQERIDGINIKLDKIMKLLKIEQGYETKEVFRAPATPVTMSEKPAFVPEDLKEAVEKATKSEKPAKKAAKKVSTKKPAAKKAAAKKKK